MSHAMGVSILQKEEEKKEKKKKKLITLLSLRCMHSVRNQQFTNGNHYKN